MTDRLCIDTSAQLGRWASESTNRCVPTVNDSRCVPTVNEGQIEETSVDATTGIGGR